MNARLKLNSAYIQGALAFAGLVGWLANSMELFFAIAIVLIVTSFYGGDIRTTPRRK